MLHNTQDKHHIYSLLFYFLKSLTLEYDGTNIMQWQCSPWCKGVTATDTMLFGILKSAEGVQLPNNAIVIMSTKNCKHRWKHLFTDNDKIDQTGRKWIAIRDFLDVWLDYDQS